MAYVRAYTRMRLQQNNVTEGQLAELKQTIDRLVGQLGRRKYYASVFSVMKEQKALRQVRSEQGRFLEHQYSMFRQLFANKVSSQSCRVLLLHYFEGLHVEVKRIDSFVFRGFRQLRREVHFDYYHYLYVSVHKQSFKAFYELKGVFDNLDQQIQQVKD